MVVVLSAFLEFPLTNKLTLALSSSGLLGESRLSCGTSADIHFVMPFRLTPAVKGLLIACFAGFLIQQTADQFMGGNLLHWLGLVPSSFLGQFRFWQIITYSFLHGDVFHLFLNMLMLVFIGVELERAWGVAKFLRFYFFCTVTAGVFYLLLQLVVWSGNSPMVGASGGIYGLLMAYGILFGERVLLFMLLFPMKAKHFVWVLAGVEFMATIYSGRAGLSSAAHLAGMAAGFGYLWGKAMYRVAQRRRQEGRLERSKKRRKASQHLKLVIDNEEEQGRRKGPGGGEGPR